MSNGTSAESTDVNGPLSLEDYKRVFRGHPAGVAIVTLDSGDGPNGFTATSVISVSAVPPILVFSINTTSSNWPALSIADSVVVHFLDTTQVGLSGHFATSGIDRFDNVEWHRLPTGEPVLDDVKTWVRCSIVEKVNAGSSVIIVCQLENAVIDDERSPLVYHDRAYHQLDESSALVVQ